MKCLGLGTRSLMALMLQKHSANCWAMISPSALVRDVRASSELFASSKTGGHGCPSTLCMSPTTLRLSCTRTGFRLRIGTDSEFDVCFYSYLLENKGPCWRDTGHCMSSGGNCPGCFPVESWMGLVMKSPQAFQTSCLRLCSTAA